MGPASARAARPVMPYHSAPGVSTFYGTHERAISDTGNIETAKVLAHPVIYSPAYISQNTPVPSTTSCGARSGKWPVVSRHPGAGILFLQYPRRFGPDRADAPDRSAPSTMCARIAPPARRYTGARITPGRRSRSVSASTAGGSTSRAPHPHPLQKLARSTDRRMYHLSRSTWTPSGWISINIDPDLRAPRDYLEPVRPCSIPSSCRTSATDGDGASSIATGRWRWRPSTKRTTCRRRIRSS